MTLDEAFDQFSESVEEFQNFSNLQASLLQSLDNVAADIARRAPVKTGALRRSIAFLVEQTEGQSINIAFRMRNYGWFQNYGVKGIRNTAQYNQVPDQINSFLQPQGSKTFAFGVNTTGKRYWGVHYSGVNAKSFLNFRDLQQQVAEITEIEITKIFE